MDIDDLSGSGPSHANCPITDLLARLGDKWSMLVLVTLARADGHCLRFSEMMRDVEGISQRMLTTTLRHLERDGIVTRHIYPEVPPRVEYTMTARGLELLIPVRELVEWMLKEWPEIEKSRAVYDAAQELKNVKPSGRHIQRLA